MTDQQDEMREPSEKELKAYADLGPMITTGQERELGRMIFFAVGILVGGFLMGACWLVTSLG